MAGKYTSRRVPLGNIGILRARMYARPIAEEFDPEFVHDSDSAFGSKFLREARNEMKERNDCNDCELFVNGLHSPDALRD